MRADLGLILPLPRATAVLKSTPFLGLVLFAFSAGFPPFDDATEVDLTLHFLQHVLIVFSGVMIAYPFYRSRPGRFGGGRVVAPAALAASASLIVFWHFPGPWDDALINPAVHVVEHISFLTVGLLSGSVLLRLSDSGKIGALLSAFFGHLGYAVVLISPWNLQVYSLYPLSDQTILGWVLLLTGPTLVVGVAYVLARNPGWLGGTANEQRRRETFVNRVRIPKWLTPGLSMALVLVLLGYFSLVAVAASQSNPPPAPGISEVDIRETPVSWQYSPQSLTVVLGVNSTVLWVSHSLSYDTVTDRGGAFNSGPIAPGQSFQFVFTRPGVYEYHCVYHPWMTGTITVVAKSP